MFQANQNAYIKDGAYCYRSIFARFMTMREKQILARTMKIQEENWEGVGGSHAFYRDN